MTELEPEIFSYRPRRAGARDSQAAARPTLAVFMKICVQNGVLSQTQKQLFLKTQQAMAATFENVKP